VELPNGNFLLPVNYSPPRSHDGTDFITSGDCLIEIDRINGTVVNAWDFFELLLDYDDYLLNWNKKLDWFHMNSVEYDSSDDTVIVSSKYAGLIKVSRNGFNGADKNLNKGLVWILPNPDKADYFSAANPAASGKCIVPENPEWFHYPSHQHNPVILPSNNGKLHILILNNEYSEGVSALTEYAVDEVSKTASEVWSFGSDTTDYYSNILGGTGFLPLSANRIMFSPLPASPKLELTSEGETVFKYLIKSSSSAARWYRCGRIELYPFMGE
jgi:arylsulfate sulfotransferase